MGNNGFFEFSLIDVRHLLAIRYQRRGQAKQRFAYGIALRFAAPGAPRDSLLQAV
jgi:hypothetical protein